ncbi:MAG: hypothetical protein AVDCRST_MAG54-2436, partial [uncultured Actinomycetospora sp.]
ASVGATLAFNVRKSPSSFSSARERGPDLSASLRSFRVIRDDEGRPEM